MLIPAVNAKEVGGINSASLHQHGRGDGVRKEDGVYAMGKRAKGYRWYDVDGALWRERKDDSAPDEEPPQWSGIDSN
jgi:hypothetical protein